MCASMATLVIIPEEWLCEWTFSTDGFVGRRADDVVVEEVLKD